VLLTVNVVSERGWNGGLTRNLGKANDILPQSGSSSWTNDKLPQDS
jgi:hypothetical protein